MKVTTFQKEKCKKERKKKRLADDEKHNLQEKKQTNKKNPGSLKGAKISAVCRVG